MDKTLRPINQKTEAALRTLCDLSSKDMTALHSINLSHYALNSHPSTLVALCRDKLIVEAGAPRRYTLTTLGHAVYERGRQVVNEG